MSKSKKWTAAVVICWAAAALMSCRFFPDVSGPGDGGGGDTQPQVSTPVFSPPAMTFTGTLTLQIGTVTEGASIYYSLDGSAPTRESAAYTAPFLVTQTTTVKAMAVREGMLDSEVAEAVYTKEVLSQTQTVSPDGGQMELVEEGTGARLLEITIPAGAVAVRTTVTVTVTESTSPAMGDLFLLDAGGVVFDLPLEIEIDYRAYAASSGLAAEQIGLYCLTDFGTVCPIRGFVLDQGRGVLCTHVLHFSGLFAGPSQADIAALCQALQALGYALSPELLADYNAIWDTYAAGNTDPMSRASFDAGVENVKAWCYARVPDLEFGEAWKTIVTPSGIDYMIVTGFVLLIDSGVCHKVGDAPVKDLAYETMYCSNNIQGEEEFYTNRTELTYRPIVGQIREWSDTVEAETNDRMEVFDILIYQSASEPVLAVEPAEGMALEDGEVGTITARLSFKYYNNAMPEIQEAGKSEETVKFEKVSGPGSFSVAEDLTDDQGFAESVFTADWEKEATEEEETVVRVSFKHQSLTLAEEITIKKSLIAKVSVSGGAFLMGSTTGQSNEQPVHSVTVSSYRISKHEVTQAQYQTVMGSNPSYFTGDTRRPVEQVTWYNAVSFCNALSALEGLESCYTINGTTVTVDWSRNGYRLPTEAEWEFAARGGTLSQGYTYSGSNTVGDVAWYYDNAGSATHAVGTKAANELGIYDMSGNVLEWCWDRYGFYGSGAQTDPTGPGSGSYRVLRGGSWNVNAYYLRSAYRDGGSPTYADRYAFSAAGFRVVRRGG